MNKILKAMAVAALVFSGQSFAWEICAVNGTVCANKGPMMVRYGFDGNWAAVQQKGSIDCLAQMFVNGAIEGDPFSPAVADVDKRCEKM